MQIQDGHEGTENAITKRHCGNTPPPNFVTVHNFMSLLLHTDSSHFTNNIGGFQLNWTAVKPSRYSVV